MFYLLASKTFKKKNVKQHTRTTFLQVQIIYCNPCRVCVYVYFEGVWKWSIKNVFTIPLHSFLQLLNSWDPSNDSSCGGRQTFPVLFFPVLHGPSVCLNPLSKRHNPWLLLTYTYLFFSSLNNVDVLSCVLLPLSYGDSRS